MGTLAPLAPATFLHAIRVFRGWSRPELARRAGLDRECIENLEYGFATPTVEELDRLWTALNAEESAAPDPPNLNIVTELCEEGYRAARENAMVKRRRDSTLFHARAWRSAALADGSAQC